MDIVKLRKNKTFPPIFLAVNAYYMGIQNCVNKKNKKILN